MKRRSATGVDASGKLDVTPEGRATAPAGRSATTEASRGAESEDNELDEPLPDAEHLVAEAVGLAGDDLDRKSTRLNSSHSQISYAVFCLKKKKTRTVQACRSPAT